MIALYRFALSPIDDPSISYDELAAYASDHNQRMSAQNPDGNALSARIAATATALTAFHDALDSDQSQLGLRKGAKLVKTNFRKDLTGEAEKIVAAVIAEYGSDSPQVLSVVPQGRTVFSEARDDRLQDHLQTLVDGITALEATLGAPLTARATDLRDAWDAIYQASEISTGDKIASEQAKQAARANLSWELYRNLMAIADLFPRQPDKMRLYCNQALLGIPEPTGSGDGDGGDGGGGEGYSSSSAVSSSSLSSASSSSSLSSESSSPTSPSSSSSSSSSSTSSSSSGSSTP